MTDTTFPVTSTSCVITAPGELELRQFTVPEPEADAGVLEVEATGVCGADVEMFRGDGPTDFPPVALGHEMIGRIADVGERAADRWGVQAGDRVVVNEIIPCGNCHFCTSGQAVMCNGFFGSQGSRYGLIPTTTGSGAWGGFGTHMQLHPNTNLRRIDDSVPTAVAAMFMPVANGMHWLFDLAGLTPGASVLIVGPGSQGLAVTAVAHSAAGLHSIVAGRSADAHRLDLARQVGATRTVDTQSEDLVEIVKEETRGMGVDAVIIATSGADDVLSTATRCVRIGGTIVLAGTNSWKSERKFKGDALVFRNITLRGAPGHSVGSVEGAVRILERAHDTFAPLVGEEYHLDQVAQALSDPFATTGGVHRSVRPTLSSRNS